MTRSSKPRLGRIALVVAGLAAVSLPLVATASAGATPSVGTTMMPTRAPWVSRIYPGAGPSTGGEQVRIIGHHFTRVSAVRFGGIAATSYVVVNDNEMTATSPAHIPALPRQGHLSRREQPAVPGVPVRRATNRHRRLTPDGRDRRR